ncbi:MAG: M48 family metallopeptidase [Rhodospirillales bacterium]|nr:M48 family metallopeptidase [Rhodospirillales bacterium]
MAATVRRRRAKPGKRIQSSHQVIDLGTVAPILEVRRHPRARRASLRMTADGSGVVVVLPACYCVEDGLAIAREHAQWIRDRLGAAPIRIPFNHGAVLPVHGRATVVRHEPSSRAHAHHDQASLIVGGPASMLSRRVESWLRSEAARVLDLRVTALTPHVARAPTLIRVRDTRSRWGSCSSTGKLSFSWRLILAPPAVLDYVVAHEMAHLEVAGHGPDFWRRVEDLAVDVEASRAWLRHHGRNLFCYG